MAGFELSMPGGSDPGLSALQDLYKTSMTQFKDAQKEEYNRAKSTVASLIDSYHKADSQTLQEDIIEMMKSYQTVLPPHLKVAVEPYIVHGPTSPTAEKRRQFEQMFKRPEPPKFLEGTGESVDIQNKIALGKYWFANADYDHALKTFMVGAEAAGDRPYFFPYGDGSGVMRNKEGRLTYLSQSDLDLKSLEEKYGISPREILLNPDGIPTGKTSILNLNGQQITYEQTLKPLASKDQQYGQRIKSITAIPKSALDEPLPTNLTKLLLNWKRDDQGDDTFLKDLKDRLDKVRLKGDSPSKSDVKAWNDETSLISNTLSSVFHGYSFEIQDTSKPEPWYKAMWNIIPFVSANTDYAIIPIKGVPIGIKDAAGKVYTYYYDRATDMVYDISGQFKGSLAQVTADIGSRTVKLEK